MRDPWARAKAAPLQAWDSTSIGAPTIEDEDDYEKSVLTACSAKRALRVSRAPLRCFQ